MSDGNAEAHARICNDSIIIAFLTEGNMMTVRHIHMGANRCSILDIDRKFARHFKQSRISVDNAFKISGRKYAKKACPMQSRPLNPGPGLLLFGLHRKDNKNYNSNQKIQAPFL